jgi:hypothetical protein
MRQRQANFEFVEVRLGKVTEALSQNIRDWGCMPVVEYLPSVCKALIIPPKKKI